jgi:hypothetical protein
MKQFFLIITIISGLLQPIKAQKSNDKTEFENALKTYFKLKNGLAADDVNKASTGSKELLASLKTFPIKTLTLPQQEELKKQLIEIQKYAALIVTERDLNMQRKSFERVALAMIKLVKVVNLNSNDVYVQYCPMVKRSWLNEVKEVQNPFYGNKMYDCGEVTETIAKK